MSHPSRAALGVVSAVIAAGTVALPATTATAVSPDIVISEVYGGGGNSGARLKNDFVELHNTGSTAVDVSTWSVQYASATSDGWRVTDLTGSMAPGARYLVQEAPGAGGTDDLPTPDATGSTAMSGTAGKVAVVTDQTPLACSTGCTPGAAVKDFVGYGSSASSFEGTGPTSAPSNTTSVSRDGPDTDNNSADFEPGDPSPTNSAGEGGEPEPPTEVEDLEIHDIQGTAHLSAYEGDRAIDVPGVVTVVRGNGFWMQSQAPDDKAATSEGILVFTGSAPTVAVGDRVTVTGDVQEFRPGNDSDNLTTTELSDPDVTVVGPAASVPLPQIVGPGGRVPPAKVIDDDASGNVETGGSFDAAQDGIDFWESMEGMLVGIDNAQVTGPTSGFGELPVVPEGSGRRTARDGIVVAPDDFNPERILLDDVLADTPQANTGDTLAGTTAGVLDYSFSNFKLLVTTEPTVVPGSHARETTRDDRGSELSIASYNVENLDPTDPPEKFDALADQIVANLASPDIVGLEEVQDNDGATNSGTTAADETLRLLTSAIRRAGGPSYDWRQIDPVNNQEGGEPGGNIRVAFLFKEGAGLRFVDRGVPSSTQGTAVFDGRKAAHITRSPGRINPTSPAWDDSRVPLVGEFRWRGKPLFLITNHFGSKGGDEPLFGPSQPPVRSSETKRHLQAGEVRSFVDELLDTDRQARVAVLGDINDFEFSETTDILVGSGSTALSDLPRTLPANERYTYVFEGNSQVLDHILLSRSLVDQRYAYDIVHVNAEYSDQISDHDPQVVRIGR